MEYKIKPKPTKYNGVQFRSRLEAKWAAFFDILKWPWLYEPVDLGEWSPDFIISGAATLLVEVKPILQFHEETAGKVERGVGVWGKMHVGEWVDGLLLGIGPRYDDPCGPSIGWLTESFFNIKEDPDQWGVDWGNGMFGCWVDKNPSGRTGICHDTQSFRDRISGGYDGGCFGEKRLDLRPEIEAAWALATNKVQWHKGK